MTLDHWEVPPEETCETVWMGLVTVAQSAVSVGALHENTTCGVRIWTGPWPSDASRVGTPTMAVMSPTLPGTTNTLFEARYVFSVTCRTASRNWLAAVPEAPPTASPAR